MRHLIAVFVLGVTLFSAAAAQTTFTVGWQLPPGFPSSTDAPYFAARDCLAVLSYSSIFVLEGLPDSAAMTSQVVPIPNLGYPSVVAENTLLYRDVTGELILIRGLPGDPTQVPTGIVEPSGGSFIAANPTTALMQKNGVEWHVLRHEPAGASLSIVTLPVWSYIGAGSFHAGPAGPDRFLVTGGTDHRTLIVFEGLSGPPSGFAVSTYQIPGSGSLDGFLVTETGSGVAYNYTSSTEILLSVVRFIAGAPSFTTYSATAPAWSSTVEGRGVCAVSGDNLICRWRDAAWDFPTALIIGIESTPEVAHTWLEQGESSCWTALARSLARDELITGLPYPASMTYHWFSGPNPGSRSLAAPGNSVVDVAKPNRDTLLVLSRASYSSPQFWLTVFTDLDGAATPHPIGITHYDAMGPTSPQLMIMSPGMVAVLAKALSPWPGLTLVGLPTICEVAPSTMNGTPLHLSASGGPPDIGSPFEILAWGPEPSSDVWLAAATSLGEPTVLPYPPFDSFSTLHLDPAAFLGLIPAPSIGPGLWSADLGLQLFPPALAGLELYLQGVRLTGTTFGLGNTLLLIPG